MASTVKKGSSGNDVYELQQKLNAAGYDLDVDGQFGSKTQAAVRDYQQKNGLAVDGIVGTNTWASLNSSAASASARSATADMLASIEASRPSYGDSSELTALKSRLSEAEANRPAEYVSPYGSQLDALYDQIVNRPKFEYNFDADPIYQQYRQQYVNNGKLAMQDTMGQAAALTGGYGSSYATTAGSQAYQNYLQGLNDVIPGLRNAAYNEYVDEGNDLRANYDTLFGREQDAYGKYRDTVNDWRDDLAFIYQQVDDMSNRELELYSIDSNAWAQDRDYWYGKLQDELAQQQAQQVTTTKKSGGDGGSKEVANTVIGAFDKEGTGGGMIVLNKKWDGTGSSAYAAVGGTAINNTTLDNGISSGKIKKQVVDGKVYYYYA